MELNQNMIETLLIIILSTVLFFPLVSEIFKERSIFSLSISYLLGLAVWTYFFFILNTLGFPFTLKIEFSVYFSILILVCLTSFRRRIYMKKVALRSILVGYKKMLMRDKVLWLLLLILIVSSLIMNIYWPVKDWDSLVLYDFRAKIFALQGGFADILTQKYYLSYPPMTSLTHTLLYLLNPQASPMLLYFSYYISLLLIFYTSLRKLNINQRIALVSTTFLAGNGIIFEHSQIAYTNLLYMLFLFVGFVLVALWLKSKKASFLIFSSIFVGLSGWIRFTEPFWLVMIIAVSIILFMKKRFTLIPIYGFVAYILRYPWSSYLHKMIKSSLGSTDELSNSVQQVSKNINLSHIGIVVKYLYFYIFAEYGIILLIYLVLFCFNFVYLHKKLTKGFAFDLLVILGLVGSICIGTLIFSLTRQTWLEIGDSAKRMSMVLVPVVLFSTVKLVSMASEVKN